MYYLLTLIQLMIVALILLAATGADAQEREQEHVLDCLGEVDAPWFDEYRDLGGVDIWVGYENGGFDIPSDVSLAHKLYGVGVDRQPILIWIAYAPSTPNLTYWLPFNNTTVYDVPGQRYKAIHPCGAFRVSILLGDVIE